MVDEPAQLRERAQRACGQTGALAEALRTELGGDPRRLVRTACVVPGDGRMQHPVLARRAARPPRPCWSRRRPARGPRERRRGPRPRPPRPRRRAPRGRPRRRWEPAARGSAPCHGRARVRPRPRPPPCRRRCRRRCRRAGPSSAGPVRTGRRRPAGDQHELAAHAARPGAVRQQQRVAPAQRERLTVLGLERPVTLQDDEDREAGVDLGLRSRRDALGAEERVRLGGQEPGDRPVGLRSAQRRERRRPSGRRIRARSPSRGRGWPRAGRRCRSPATRAAPRGRSAPAARRSIAPRRLHGARRPARRACPPARRRRG